MDGPDEGSVGYARDMGSVRLDIGMGDVTEDSLARKAAQQRSVARAAEVLKGQ